VPTLTLTQAPAADELLGRDPLALLIGMLLDQHMRNEAVAPDADQAVGTFAHDRGEGSRMELPGDQRVSAGAVRTS
jgi:hypothetical protein